MSTFEQLIRADLMGAVKTAYPLWPRDAKSEPENCRVLLTEREFDRENYRRYAVAVETTPKKLVVYEVTADVIATAQLEIRSSATPDVELLTEQILNADSLLWTWRGNSVRVERFLRRTRLNNNDESLREVFFVEYRAPYFKAKNVPLIEAESWFDGWEFAVEPPVEPDGEGD